MTDPLGLTPDQRRAGLLDPELIANDFMRTLRNRLAMWRDIPDGTLIYCDGWICPGQCAGHLVEELR